MFLISALVFLSFGASLGEIVCRSGVKSGSDSVVCTTFSLQNEYEVDLPTDSSGATDTLDVSGCRIAKFKSTSPFESFTKIRKLILSSNSLSSISSLMFSGLEELEVLDLSKNDLRRIPSIAFLSLKKLLYLDVSDNKGLELENFIQFNSLGSLKALDASNVLSFNVYELNNKGLKELVLRGENVQFRRGVQLSLKSLLRMDLSGNTAAFLSGRMSSEIGLCRNLLHLNISDMQLDHLQLNSLSMLKVLDASRNNLKIVNTEMFSRNGDLVDIDLSFNLIENIEGGSFSENKNLVRLNLNGNRLGKATLTRDTFRPLFNLETLILSNNGIEEMSEDIFEAGSSLIALHLDGNNIKKINRNLFRSNNKLKLLDLGNNRLKVLNPDSVMHLEKLMFLYLDNNYLTRLSEKVVTLKSLTDLFLHCNEFSFLPDNFFKLPQATFLKLVTLHDNPWKCQCLHKTLFSMNSGNFFTDSFKDRETMSCMFSKNNDCVSMLTYNEIFKWKIDLLDYRNSCKKF